VIVVSVKSRVHWQCCTCDCKADVGV